MKLSVLTQNLRCIDDPNGHSIAERAPRLFAQIAEWQPDLMGFQEASFRWEPYLEPLKEQYGVIWMYRHDVSREATPVYWKKDAFELLEEEHFWLSETPEVMSKGWRADYYRICSRAALRHKESGKVLQFFNTHVDWVGIAPRESAQLIIRRAERLGDAPVFCTGDFNFAPETSGWHSMRSWFMDVREEVAPENKHATIHSYQQVDEGETWIIDYCFFRGAGVTPTKYELLTKTYEGKFVSDHYGVYFEFEVN